MLSAIDLRDYLVRRFKGSLFELTPLVAEAYATEMLAWVSKQAEDRLASKCAELGLDYKKMRAQDVEKARRRAIEGEQKP